MHSYIKTKDNGEAAYVVGHWFTGNWQPLAIFTTEAQAARWASFLNGGTAPASPEAAS